MTNLSLRFMTDQMMIHLEYGKVEELDNFFYLILCTMIQWVHFKMSFTTPAPHQRCERVATLGARLCVAKAKQRPTV